MEEPHQHPRRAKRLGTDPERYGCFRPRHQDAAADATAAANTWAAVLDRVWAAGLAARRFQAAGCRVLRVDESVQS